MTDTITTGEFAGTYDVTSEVWFEIDGLPSATTAWRCTNPFELLRPAPKRGTTADVVPNADGTSPNPLWLDGADRDLRFTVWGGIDEHGEPTGGDVEAILANVFSLGRIADIPNNPASTRPVTVHLPSAVTWSGELQVLEPIWDTTRMPGFMTVTIPVYVPAGRLVED